MVDFLTRLGLEKNHRNRAAMETDMRTVYSDKRIDRPDKLALRNARRNKAARRAAFA